LHVEKNHGRSQPPTDPSPPAVESQRLQSPGGNQIVYLNSSRAAFFGRAEVVIYHHPATLGQPITGAIYIAANIRVCIEDKQTDLARPRRFPNCDDRSLLERGSVYQGNRSAQSRARKVLFEVFENVPGRQPV
jgi:hypothetical protein